MFLPLILLDRYGWWGFVAFAIPNVLGCAAFGYVIRTRERSKALVLEHGGAMRWFSVVTIGYHLFFLGFLGRFFVPDLGEFGGKVGESGAVWVIVYGFPALLFGGAWGLSLVPTKVWPGLAAAVFAFSLYVFFAIGLEPLGDIEWSGSESLSSLGWMAPMLVLGFLASPYLDLTFHRARQEAPSKHAFGVFGVTFLVMIVLSCAYSHELMTTRTLTGLVGIHILGQILFTMAAHLREMRGSLRGSGGTVWMGLLPLLVLPLAGQWGEGESAYDAVRDMYLRFLALYGLAFPVYVVLRMGWGGASGTVIKRGVWSGGGMLVLMAVFLGLGEIGFFWGMGWMLVIPVGVLVGCRAVSIQRSAIR